MPDIKSFNFTDWLIIHGESAFRNVTGPGKADWLLDCRTNKTSNVRGLEL